MIWGLYFIALFLLIIPAIIIPSINSTIKKPVELKIYSKEEMEEYKYFEEYIKKTEIVVNDKKCRIDKKDDRYFYVNNKKVALNIANYIKYVIESE